MTPSISQLALALLPCVALAYTCPATPACSLPLVPSCTKTIPAPFAGTQWLAPFSSGSYSGNSLMKLSADGKTSDMDVNVLTTSPASCL